PALISTAWRSGSDLGFVDETSDHILAKIYRDLAHDPHPRQNHALCGSREENSITSFAQRAGLNHSTLVGRGRIMQVGADGHIRLDETTVRPPLTPTRAMELAHGLSGLGLTTSLVDKRQKAKDIDPAAQLPVDVHTKIQYIPT